MTTNGTIQIITPQQSTRDENGDYLATTETAGKAIPCLIYDIRHKNRGTYEGDKFTTSSFEILIEGSSLSMDKTKLIKITDDKGNEFGTFTVQSFVYLSNTYRTKITV